MEDWRRFPQATHGAIVAGQVSGYALTLGGRANALAVVFCPHHGEPVSVWRYGQVPRSAARAAVKFALVEGPDTRTISGKLGEDAAPLPAPQWPDPPAVAWGGWPESMPGFMTELTSAVAHAYSFDPAAVALTQLGFIAAGLTSKFYASMLTEAGEAWREQTLGLYVCGIAPSGARKTPLMDCLQAPLQALANTGAADKPKLEAAWQARVSLAKAEADRLKEEEDADPDALAEALYRASEPPPREPCPIVSNGTAPALAEELAWRDSLLVATSEGSEIFRALMTKDGRLELDPLLKAYSGQAGNTVARIMRKQPSAKAYRASVVVWTQPSVMYGLGRQPEAVEQGLLGRFLWCAQDARPPTGGVVPEDLARLWRDLLHTARALRGPERDPWGVETGEPASITASPAQTAELLKFADEMAACTEPGGTHYGLATWARKLHGQTARVAAILTWLADPRATRMRDDCLAWALAQARGTWLTWATHVWSLLTWPPNTDDARHLWAVTARAGRQTWAMQELDTLMRWPPPQVDAAVNTLAERGFASVSAARTRTARVVSFAAT